MIMFNYKIIINFCYGCDIIITTKTKRDRIEPFLIEINDKRKLIYTENINSYYVDGYACSFFILCFRKSLVYNSSKFQQLQQGKCIKQFIANGLKPGIQQTKFLSFYLWIYIFFFGNNSFFVPFLFSMITRLAKICIKIYSYNIYITDNKKE